MKKEWKRRCRRDLTVWYVPDELRKIPRMPILGSFTRQGNIAGKVTLRTACLEASQCPKCGSTAFTEEKIKL